MSADRVRQEYCRVLKSAKHGLVSPQRFYEEWYKALSKARIYRLSEIEGFLAVKDFLNSISAKLALT
jgi:hypothetical protein